MDFHRKTNWMVEVKVIELGMMKESALSRWLSRAFSIPIIYIEIVAAVMVLVGWVAAQYLKLSSAAELLVWVVPLTVLVTSFIVSFCYATYSLFTMNEERRVVSENVPESVRDVPPRICFLGWEVTEAPPIFTQVGDVQVGERPWLTRVTFANEPNLPTATSIARGVAGHIEFYDASRDSFLFGMVGQWSSDSAEETDTKTVSKIDILSNATPYYLNLVLKYDGDNECYGINNDTAARAPADGRDEKRELMQGLYTVKVMVHGTNVTETFWFGLINRGSGQRVRILQIST